MNYKYKSITWQVDMVIVALSTNKLALFYNVDHCFIIIINL